MTNPEQITNIWNTIVQSNTFNFIIFVLILVWIAKKINISSLITSLQERIIKIIKDAEKEKEIATSKLIQAQKAVENLGDELNTIISDAEKSAVTISEKLLKEAEKQIETIEQNAKKVIEAEEKMIISNLTKSTSKISIESAKTHIKNTLSQTPSLHEKYIDESINELDRLNF